MEFEKTDKEGKLKDISEITQFHPVALNPAYILESLRELFKIIDVPLQPIKSELLGVSPNLLL